MIEKIGDATKCFVVPTVARGDYKINTVTTKDYKIILKYLNRFAWSGGHDMDLYAIHQEMNNDCGDAQERIAMEGDIDPLRSPLPTGGNEWEVGFMESMRKAKRLGWTLSDKQIETLEGIRDKEERNEWDNGCGMCDEWGMCDSCLAEHEAQHDKEIERDYAHLSEKEIEAFQDYATNVLGDRDAMSGSYGSVGRFKGPCPLSYDASGYSNGWGYAVKVCKRTGAVE